LTIKSLTAARSWIICSRKWTLSFAAYKVAAAALASGEVKFTNDSWHHAELQFLNDQITVSVDGVRLASVSDKTHLQGMFAIGTGWNRVQFDNLTVTKE